MINWKTSNEPIDYLDAIKAMEDRVAGILSGTCDEQVWLLGHPHIYTAGTSAQQSDLLSDKIPVFASGRGGQYTYHGPGQRVAYVMLDLNRRSPDLRKYIFELEQWIIDSLQEVNIHGERRADRIGIWVNQNGVEKKIAAIGVRVRKWITFHGIAINVCPNLEYYKGIVPCGINEYGVTSIKKMGYDISLKEFDKVLIENLNSNSFLKGA